MMKGFRVTVVDNLSTSNSISVPKDVEFVKANIEDFTTDVDYAYYIHLAARPSPEDSILHPVETALSNSIGTLKMLEMTKRSNGIFLYASPRFPLPSGIHYILYQMMRISPSLCVS